MQQSKILTRLRIFVLASICVWLVVEVIRYYRPEEFRWTLLKIMTAEQLFKEYQRAIEVRDSYGQVSRYAHEVLSVLTSRRGPDIDGKLITYFETIRDKEAAQHLLDGVRGGKVPMPETSAWMWRLGRRNTERSRSYLLEQMNSPYPFVRSEVMWSFGPIDWNDPSNDAMLIKISSLLKDPDSRVVFATVEHLAPQERYHTYSERVLRALIDARAATPNDRKTNDVWPLRPAFDNIIGEYKRSMTLHKDRVAKADEKQELARLIQICADHQALVDREKAEASQPPR